MRCPYPDCPDTALARGDTSCATCRRALKACGQEGCHAFNRPFAVYCRRCGRPLPGDRFQWTGLRGGPQALGLNPHRLPFSLFDSKVNEVREGTLALDGPCLALLSCDDHLVAVSESGRIEVRSVDHGLSARLRADGPLTCHPCIDGSTLFVGRAGALSAHSLSALTVAAAPREPRWTVEIPGRPVQALLALADQLFFVFRRDDGRHEVACLRGTSERQPSLRRGLHVGSRISTLAADPITRRLVFLSHDGAALHAHRVRVESPALEVEVQRIDGLAEDSAPRGPIAYLSERIFAALGEREVLYRIEPRGRATRLSDDVSKFSLASADSRVELSSTALHFAASGEREALPPRARTLGQPLLLNGCAITIGLQDGRVLLFDLEGSHTFKEQSVGSAGDGVTALASFGSHLAAGSEHGAVRLFELRAAGGKKT